jgi:hypothetical protein
VCADQRLVHFDEGGAIFVGEADGTGQPAGIDEAVTGSDGGGGGLGFGRDRPRGFFPVGTGGGAAEASG